MIGRIGVYTKRPMPMAAAIASSPPQASRIEGFWGMGA